VPLPMGLSGLADALRAGRGAANGLPSVRWLSMGQLARTGLEVVQAAAFARFADKREAMAASPREFYRLVPRTDSDVWVDYVADTGDGFDATFATACCVAGVPGLTVAGSDGRPVEFPDRPPQADLLVLGGDEVYPVASAAAYEIRLNEVFRAAGRVADMVADPPVVALPGNHDWYDGLGAFRRNFCESWVLRDREHRQGHPQAMDVPPVEQRDDVGGWGAFQSRSYFAMQLSPRWWLWAVDSQLDAPIDAEQLAYFRDAARLLGDGTPDGGERADVILCTATPSWLEATGSTAYAALADTPFYTLLWFVDRVLGPDRDRVRMVLTGDEHNYAHYTPTESAVPGELAPELVTCGGGGAYLASTHHLGDTLRAALQPWPSGSGQVAGYRLGSCYPTREESRGLASGGRFLAAGWRNGLTLPALWGVVDLLLFLLFQLCAMGQVVPFLTTVVVVAALLGIYASTGVPAYPPLRRKWPTVAGLMLPHTLAHVAVAVTAAELFTLAGPTPPWWLYPLVFVALAVLGTIVFVSYLHLADLVGCHRVEAFSALRLDGYKSHLRLQVTDDHIRVHVLGMDTVPASLHANDLRTCVPKPRLIDEFEIVHSLATTPPVTVPPTPKPVR
jgi:hypothetical protein